MLDSQLYRKLSLTAAVLGVFIVSGSSKHPGVLAVSADVEQPVLLLTFTEGTTITATVGQTLTSPKNRRGDSFVANIARPVKVDGKTVRPRGTEVTGHIAVLKDRELKVVLDSVVVHGISCDVATNSRRPSDKDQPKRKGEKNKGQKHKKDNSTLSASTRLTFKLSKPATIPAKA